MVFSFMRWMRRRVLQFGKTAKQAAFSWRSRMAMLKLPVA